MSLQRMLLRSLACVALQQQDDDLIPPTMAETRVFDTQLSPFVMDEQANAMPVITVYTDDDEGDLINRGGGVTGPFARKIDLRVEIAIGSFDTTLVDGVAQMSFVVPMTDSQLEAQLIDGCFNRAHQCGAGIEYGLPERGEICEGTIQAVSSAPVESRA